MMSFSPRVPSLKHFLAPKTAVILVAAVLIALSLAVGLPRPAAAQTGVPPVTNIEAVDGQNPGEVVVSWDAVPEATHYRIGYVSIVDMQRATARGGKWTEAFAYVDVAAEHLPKSGERSEYTIHRLAQGVNHAFTVLISANYITNDESVSGEFFWSQGNERWRFLTVADRGGACPTIGSAAASADADGATSQGAGTTAADTSEGGATGTEDPGPQGYRI